MPTLRRRHPRAQGALAIAALLVFLVAGCKRESPSRSAAQVPPSHPQGVAKAQDAPRAPLEVPVQRPRFAVQVAALDDRSNAEALASRLSDHFGLQTLVAPVEANGATLYRVRLLVGSKEEADKLAETFLRTENLKVWIAPL